ncbi:hypothetical protein MXT02_13855 [Escherichia coli]|uniref:hypothetical protein n=1 Tax=Escherichia coli TaxID=562 RepID=UPI0028E0C31B|nr:hypothetical protein [Escherichia coli]MDT9460447.1 hypothetical protein [Escherichia coli]
MPILNACRPMIRAVLAVRVKIAALSGLYLLLSASVACKLVNQTEEAIAAVISDGAVAG